MRARFRPGLARILCAVLLLGAAPVVAVAAPYAAMVIDARSGDVLHSRNADTRLHPASLTKMMTLYVVFQAVEAGEIGLDDDIRISRHAASEPPSKLGLRAGSTIKLRYLIRAAAVKSANDAATALGEAVSGSEDAFARRMTRTAQAMGMTNTTFRNAHGLTQNGHMSTARDMTTLGRRLFFDFPAYYNLFSRRSTHAGLKAVNNTNQRLLSAYRGADGIKTGFTRAAGYNLVASAERGSERVIATVFGGTSTAQRNARVAELLDMGFQRAPTHVAVRPPAPLDLRGVAGIRVAHRGPPTRSPRPLARPGPDVGPVLAEVVATEVAAQVSRGLSNPSTAAIVPGGRPEARPVPEEAPAEDPVADAVAASTAAVLREIVHRPGTDAPRGWSIAVGRHHTEYQAERTLLKIALTDVEALEDGRRSVVRRPTGWEARFVGLTRADADRACRRIRARGGECEPLQG